MNASSKKRTQYLDCPIIVLAFNRATELYPTAAAIWKEKLAVINPAQIEAIFARCPEGRITPTSAIFAKALIKHNFEQIIGLEFKLTIDPTETSLDLTPQSDIQDPDNSPDPPASPARRPSRPQLLPTPPTLVILSICPRLPILQQFLRPLIDRRQSLGSTTRSINLSRLAQEYNREAAEMLEETNQKIKALVESPTQPLMETPLMTEGDDLIC